MVTALLVTALSQPPTFYVSPGGNDRNAGTITKPFATPEQGLLAVSKLREGGYTNSIRLVLRGGAYFLAKPLGIGPSVSGKSGETVISAFSGEKPVLIGGFRLTGWKKHGSQYTTRAPGSFHVNQLFMDGTRYLRPRLPEAGYYHVSDIVPSPDRTTKGDRALVGDPSMPANFEAEQDGTEVIVFHNWEISRFRVEGPIQADKVVHFKGATQTADWGLVRKGARYLLENVRRALRPGEFTFDANTRDITVMPLSGREPTRSQVVIPTLDVPIQIEGAVDNPVSNVVVKGISFDYSTWTLPAEGRTFPQAEADLPGAVSLKWANNITFDHCEIAHTGGYALEVGSGCHDVRFQNGAMTDLGAGGAKIGPMARTEGAFETKSVTLRNNLIAGGDRVHPAGVGVWIGQSALNLIEGNEIADLTYTGISLGWSWGYAPTSAHGNRLIGNHIHDIGRGVLSDMGGIYHLGLDPDTVIAGNRIHDVQSFDYGGWGLYLDEGSTGVTVEDNIVYRCSRQSFHQHYGKDNLIKGNILAFAGEAQLARTRAEDHLSFTLKNNIVLWKATPLLWGNWEGGQFASDNNLFRRTDGLPVTFNQRSIPQWQALGNDRHSTFGDPLFVDAEHDDFRLRPNSPAIALGFAPMDPKGKPWPSRWRLTLPAFPASVKG